jgi:hypothetical protein
MKLEGQLLPEQPNIAGVSVGSPADASNHVVFTRDHDVIKRWAQKRHAEPGTGEATSSGPATVNVQDGGAGIRFNFPGASPYRAIAWEEWLDNFDRHECAFVFDNDSDGTVSNRYRIVKAWEWKDFLR